MLEFGDIGIKGDDDVASIIKSGISKEDFIFLYKIMSDRWGHESAFSSIAGALYDYDISLVVISPKVSK